MTDIDPSFVMAEHEGTHKCWGGGWSQPQQHYKSWGPCLSYRLAEALVAAQEDFARLSAYSAAAFDQPDAAQDALAAKEAR